MKRSLIIGVLLVFVYNCGNGWSIFGESQSDGLLRVPLQRMKIIGPNFEKVRNATQFELRKYNDNYFEDNLKSIFEKLSKFNNIIFYGHISIGTPGQAFRV
jgi:hypothetical protein